ncbi:hypothetical protein GW17_00035237 [Ensete ventricosum]|nr:hypothetical protein GW17_00035237 [Ensete ventricosum]
MHARGKRFPITTRGCHRGDPNHGAQREVPVWELCLPLRLPPPPSLYIVSCSSTLAAEKTAALAILGFPTTTLHRHGREWGRSRSFRRGAEAEAGADGIPCGRLVSCRFLSFCLASLFSVALQNLWSRFGIRSLFGFFEADRRNTAVPLWQAPANASVHETVKRLKELLRIAGFPELALAFDVFLPKGWDAPAPSVSERKPDYRDALNHVRRVRVKRMRCGIVSSSPQDEERPTNSNDAPAGEKEGSPSLYADCNLSTLEHSKSEKYVERHSAVGTDQRGSSKIGMVQKETQKNLNNLLPVQKPSRRFDHCVAEPPQKGDEAT